MSNEIPRPAIRTVEGGVVSASSYPDAGEPDWKAEAGRLRYGIKRARSLAYSMFGWLNMGERLCVCHELPDGPVYDDPDTYQYPAEHDYTCDQYAKLQQLLRWLDGAIPDMPAESSDAVGDGPPDVPGAQPSSASPKSPDFTTGQPEALNGQIPATRCVETWECWTCGVRMDSPSEQMRHDCPEAPEGVAIVRPTRPMEGWTWLCKCGSHNERKSRFCYRCGADNPAPAPILSAWGGYQLCRYCRGSLTAEESGRGVCEPCEMAGVPG